MCSSVQCDTCKSIIDAQIFIYDGIDHNGTLLWPHITRIHFWIIPMSIQVSKHKWISHLSDCLCIMHLVHNLSIVIQTNQCLNSTWLSSGRERGVKVTCSLLLKILYQISRYVHFSSAILKVRCSCPIPLDLYVSPTAMATVPMFHVYVFQFVFFFTFKWSRTPPTQSYNLCTVQANPEFIGELKWKYKIRDETRKLKALVTSINFYISLTVPSRQTHSAMLGGSILWAFRSF